jgi:hypothetical protein
MFKADIMPKELPKQAALRIFHTPSTLGIKPDQTIDPDVALKELVQTKYRAENALYNFFEQYPLIQYLFGIAQIKEAQKDKVLATNRKEIAQILADRRQDTLGTLTQMGEPTKSAIQTVKEQKNTPNPKAVELLEQLTEKYGDYSFIPLTNKDNIVGFVARGLDGNGDSLLISPEGVFQLRIRGYRYSEGLPGNGNKEIWGWHASESHNEGKYSDDNIKLFTSSVKPGELSKAINTALKPVNKRDGSHIELYNKNGSFGKHRPEKQSWSASIKSLDIEDSEKKGDYRKFFAGIMRLSQEQAAATADRNLLSLPTKIEELV